MNSLIIIFIKLGLIFLFLLSNKLFLITYLLNFFFKHTTAYLFLNNLIVGIFIFKNVTHINIIIIKFNFFIIELFIDINIILLLK